MSNLRAPSTRCRWELARLAEASSAPTDSTSVFLALAVFAFAVARVVNSMLTTKEDDCVHDASEATSVFWFYFLFFGEHPKHPSFRLKKTQPQKKEERRRNDAMSLNANVVD